MFQKNNMENQNKNYFGLLIIPLIAVIYSVHYFTNVNWVNEEPIQAAITSGTETQANGTNIVLTAGTDNKPDTAMDAEGNMIIVWANGNASGEDVYYRRFDAQGTAIDGAEVVVATTNDATQQRHPSVAMDESGNFVIAWEGDGPGDTDGIFLQAYQSNGTQIGATEIIANTTGAAGAAVESYPHVSLDIDGTPGSNNTRFVVTWRSNTGGSNHNIYAQRFDVDFTQSVTTPATVGTEILVSSAQTSVSNTRSSAAMNTLGEFMINWNDNASYYQMYAQNGTAIGSNVNATSGATYPGSITGTHVATDKAPRPTTTLDDATERRFVIVHDIDIDPGSVDHIAARRISCTDPNASNGTDTDVTCLLDSTEILASDGGGNELVRPDVAMDYLGNFTVLWAESLGASNYDLEAQSFNYLGKRIGTAFNPTTSGLNKDMPSISMNNDGFYTTAHPDGNAMRFQNYITEIFKTQSETLGHTTSANNQANTNTAIALNGNIAQVWTDYNANSIQFTLRQYNPTNSPPDYTDLFVDAVVSSAGNVDNPQVSFFKDTGGTGIGKFIIVWESDSSGDKDIYYQVYNADGTVDVSATAINSNANVQTNPSVAAGFYNPGGTGSGPAITEFAVGYVDETATNMEASYNSSGFTNNTLGSCTNCGDIEVDLNPNTNNAVYAWQSEVSSLIEVFIRQTEAGAIPDAALQISPAPLDNGDPDIAFISSDDYVVTYTEIQIGGAISNVFAQTYEFGASGPTNAGTRFNLTQHPASTDTEISTAVAGDISNNRFFAVWGDTPPVITFDKDAIFGQFYDFTAGGGTNVTAFGPTFRINSTLGGNQNIPDVAMNEAGQIIVGWEGNYDQSGTTDSNATIYQILQDPQNQQAVLELTPLAQQEIQAGGQFLDVPTTISFPDVALSATDSTVQSVSVRDATYGGDVKYVEIQDATGVDFTFTVQAGDFFSSADGKSYIKNDQHFRVKNWDNDLTDINAGDCDNATTPTDPDMCFNTVESTVTPTAFTLNSATENFIFAESQVVLAEKQGTTDNEIGRWRIYPTFEITVPPLIPPGAHNAQITFTLT